MLPHHPPAYDGGAVVVKRFLFKSFSLYKDLAEVCFEQGVADDVCLGVQHLLGQQHAPADQFLDC